MNNQKKIAQTDTSKYEDDEVDMMMKDCEDKLEERKEGFNIVR